jgi:hypothetical protein
MRPNPDHRAEFSDFTEEGYRSLLLMAQANYVFRGYRAADGERTILWRHDVDVSMHRALRCAEIEAELGVIATYFLYPRSIFYNLMSTDVHAAVRGILSLGHEIALHFDPTHYGLGLSRQALAGHIKMERDLLQREFGVTPTAVSFHLYGVLEEPMPDDEIIGGLVNAYSSKLRETCSYVSDSNGVWLYRRLHDVLSEAKHDRLQVLTHPEWWTPEVMPPRARLQRAIDGYAAAMGRWYDETVDRSGRPNLR